MTDAWPPWPMVHHDTRHSGVGESTFPAAGRVAWSYRAGMVPFDGRPALGPDGTIYVTTGRETGASSGRLYAVRPDGTVTWRRGGDDTFASDPVVGPGGEVYIQIAGAGLAALAPERGARRWSARGGTEGSACAVGADGTIYLGTEDDGLVALSPRGRIRWHLPTGSPALAPAVGPDGDVVVCCLDGRLLTCSPAGALRWTTSLAGVVIGPPLFLSDGLVVVWTHLAYLYAVEPDGRVRWTRRFGETATLRPAARGTTIYVVDAAGELRAVVAGDGEALLVPTPDRVTRAPAVAPDGTLLVATADEALHALDRAGAVRWTSRLRAAASTDPVATPDGTVYVGTAAGEFCAVGPDGIERWVCRATEGAAIAASPAVASDGSIVFASDDGGIQAVDADGGVRWRTNLGDPLNYGPAIGRDGTLYVCSNVYEAAVHALDAGGRLVWTHRFDQPIIAYPLVTSGRLVVVSLLEDTLVALAPDGHVAWTFAMGAPRASGFGPLEGADGRIYCASADGQVCVLDLGGELVDVIATAISSLSELALTADGLLLARSSNTLYAIAGDGSELWRYAGDVGDHLLAGPSVAGSGTIYVGSSRWVIALSRHGTLQWRFQPMAEAVSGVCSLLADTQGAVVAGTTTRLYALDASGALRWTLRLRGLFQAGPVMGADGSLYVGSSHGLLHAIRGRGAG